VPTTELIPKLKNIHQCSQHSTYNSLHTNTHLCESYSRKTREICVSSCL